MDYKDIELDEEDLTLPTKREFHFVIADDVIKKFLKSQMKTYKQFEKFPPHHPSYKSLQYTGAIYESIFKKLYPSG